MAPSRAIDFFLPVGIGFSKKRKRQSFTLVASIGLLDELTILVTGHHIECLFLHAHRHTTGIRHLNRLVGMSSFGRNDDNTIGTSRTIDSSCRSIFQHIEAFNVLRVDHRERIWQSLYTVVVHCNTVNHNQRIVGRIQRRTATDTDTGTTTRYTTTGCDVHTGYLALHHILCIDNKTFVLAVRLNLTYRTGKVWFLHGTISDNNNFIECFVIIFESCREIVGCLNLLWGHTDIGNRNFCALRYIHNVVSIKVGYAHGFTVCHNRGTDNRLSGSILDLTSDRTWLCKGRCRKEQTTGNGQTPQRQFEFYLLHHLLWI